MPTKRHLEICLALTVLFSFSHCASREPKLTDMEGPPTMSSAIKKAPTVPFCELVRNPAHYEKSVIRTRVVLRVDLENEVLYEPECDFPEGHVWAEFDPSYVYSDPQLKEKLGELLRRTATNPTRTLQVTIVGRFEGFNGKGYGHLNGYRFRFSIMRIEQADPVVSRVSTS
jgi:hypothetical protein